MKPIITLTTVFLFMVSCNTIDDQVFCTEEFRTIAVTITGANLDDFYTIRESTEDTIRFSLNNVPFENIYPILDDSFQPIIAESEETFNFLGLINEVIMVDEGYVIAADECHISLVSGKAEIAL
ncbi:MAG: hypothetical protein GY816_23710 [Cytophagales bacterium]|nr:hypothetical protein [Cytophagales bacterium]